MLKQTLADIIKNNKEKGLTREQLKLITRNYGIAISWFDYDHDDDYDAAILGPDMHSYFFENVDDLFYFRTEEYVLKNLFR